MNRMKAPSYIMKYRELILKVPECKMNTSLEDEADFSAEESSLFTFHLHVLNSECRRPLCSQILDKSFTELVELNEYSVLLCQSE